MKVNVYKILSECVEQGILVGWNRSHKHTDTPSEEIIKDRIENAIMEQIREYFIFDEEN